ncbi:MAG: type II secretion system protein [Clostridia bacterium]|nr:type II secretion system protein [Clostridia bacterium]
MRRSARFFAKSKKGFTLVEIIVVVALIALAATLVVPNLTGATTRAEKDTYRSYCLQAKEDLKTFVNLLNSGTVNYPITLENYTVSNVSLSIPSGLAKALNYANRQSKFQYYVIGFTTSDASTDPTESISKATGLKSDVDIIVPVIIKNETKKTYELKGMWYYSWGKAMVMLTFDSKNNDSDGYKALYSSGH